MKVYPITESDVLTLKLTTALSATMFAIGAAFIGYAINIYVNASFYTELTPQAQVMVKAGAPLSLAVGVAFFVAGAVATISRWITWARVKKFTTTQPVPLVPQ
jgi:ABC-type transport system involved in multi-copper enzyme maturation permease subunit